MRVLVYVLLSASPAAFLLRSFGAMEDKSKPSDYANASSDTNKTKIYKNKNSNCANALV